MSRLATLISLMALCAPGAALAGGPSCGCVPTTHQVRVPGIQVDTPSVVVTPPASSGGGGGSSGGAASASSSASAGAGITAQITTTTTSSSAGSATGAAANLLAGGGGGGGWSAEAGPTSTVNLTVETGAALTTRQVCVAEKAVVTVVAIQAVCLDDKAAPHPASQVTPDRELAPGYAGEVYRCISGTRLQYTLAEGRDAANLAHGRTTTCNKGEALVRGADGSLSCRPQAPARDCNERSLLRRFGPGIKIVQARTGAVCAAWRSEQVMAQGASSTGALSLDGGVGGVVR
jgi:hypothetical protein